MTSRTFADFVAWLEAAPTGTTLPATALLETLRELSPERAPILVGPVPEPTWRERLWTVPAETRLGIREVAEAAGRPVSWAYRHTSRRSGLPRIPHRKLDGEIVFVAGEVRRWLADHEEVVEPSHTLSLSTDARRRGA